MIQENKQCEQRIPQIKDSIDNISVSINLIEQKIDLIFNRLQPILNNIAYPSVPKNQCDSKCDLANTLDSFSERIKNVDEVMCNILNSLEI